MTLPTLWIRQNMLQSPGPAYNSNERPLTEAEMKVQRSLKKLSIPEWYLNNSSHPPKILMNDTPIDLRPPSWKEQNVKKTVLCSTPIMKNRNSTVNCDGVLETEIGPPISNYQFYGTYKINRNSPSNRSPVSKKRSSPQKNQAREKKPSRLANVSRTFPRVSPSRKIQNINLVFPQQSKSSNSQTIADLEASYSPIDMSEDSLENKIIEPSIDKPATHSRSLMITDLDQSEPEIVMIEDSIIIPSSEPINRRLQSPSIISDSYAITDLDEPEPEDTSFCPDRSAEFANQSLEISKIADTSIETSMAEAKVRKMPNSRLTYIKPWKPTIRPEVKSCVTPEGKYVNATSFKLRASSTPQGSPVSLFSAPLVGVTPREDAEEPPTSGLSVSMSKKNEESIAIEPKITDVHEICDFCKAAEQPMRKSPSPSSTSRRSSGFRPRNLLPPIGEKVTNPSKSASPSPSEAFLTSKKKSADLENIVKRKQVPRQGKSLVQEIIEELNEKCRNSAQPTYVSPGSKNFVKKLVRALEKGKTASHQDQEEEEVSYRRFADYNDDDVEEEEDYRLNDDHFVESETSSEDEVKSVAVSTSISYNDTDSSSNGSDNDLHSPTMKLDYNYDWNMNVEKNINEPTKTMAEATTSMVTSTPETEDKDESVYWIPIAKTKLPRTSSLLSMMSRLSTTNPGQQSPCISPIKQTNDNSKRNAWGATYRTTEQPRTLRRIDETTILDSGYSDRSRGHSGSGSDDTWFDDTESTWTASENGSLTNFSFSLGSRLRQERRSAGQIHGRPFVI